MRRILRSARDAFADSHRKRHVAKLRQAFDLPSRGPHDGPNCLEIDAQVAAFWKRRNLPQPAVEFRVVIDPRAIDRFASGLGDWAYRPQHGRVTA